MKSREPVEYEITEVPQAPRLWGLLPRPPLYYIDSPFFGFGPFNTRKEASDVLVFMNLPRKGEVNDFCAR